MAYIIPHTKKFNHILDFLRKELGLPETIVGLELHMRKDDVLRVVKMDYMPTVKEESKNETDHIVDVTRLDSKARESVKLKIKNENDQ